MSHAPGPWELIECHCGPHRMNYIIRRGGDLRDISFVGDYPESSDARLIASAPDLLEACKKTLSSCKCAGTRKIYGVACVYCEPTLEAIAKAEATP